MLDTYIFRPKKIRQYRGDLRAWQLNNCNEPKNHTKMHTLTRKEKSARARARVCVCVCVCE